MNSIKRHLKLLALGALLVGFINDTSFAAGGKLGELFDTSTNKLRGGNIQTNTVGSSKLQSNSVVTAKIAPRAVGASKVNISQIQRALNGSNCSYGVNAISSDGSVTCTQPTFPSPVTPPPPSACSGSTPCGTPGSCYAKSGCDNTCGSTKVLDKCGVCGGDGSSCGGTCVPNSCASNTCSNSTCNDGCNIVQGTKFCPPTCTIQQAPDASTIPCGQVVTYIAKTDCTTYSVQGTQNCSCSAPNSCGTSGNCYAPGACGCDLSIKKDCAGNCGGTAVIGGCDNTCGSTKTLDCAGTCGGSAVDYNGSSAGCGCQSQVCGNIGLHKSKWNSVTCQCEDTGICAVLKPDPCAALTGSMGTWDNNTCAWDCSGGGSDPGCSPGCRYICNGMCSPGYQMGSGKNCYINPNC